MSENVKRRPVDLVEIRKVSIVEREHAAISGVVNCRECMVLRAEIADAMPAVLDELEAWRDAATDLLLADTAEQLQAARARMRALLPKSTQ